MYKNKASVYLHLKRKKSFQKVLLHPRHRNQTESSHCSQVPRKGIRPARCSRPPRT